MQSTTDMIKEKYPHATEPEILKLVRLHNREEKLKKAQKKIDEANKKRQRKIKTAEQKAKRKKENKVKYDVGGLVVKACLEDWDRETLLGALMAIKRCEKDFPKKTGWKQAGAEGMKIPGALTPEKFGPMEVKTETSTPMEVKTETSTPMEVIETPHGDNRR
ncbi:MAG: conjugal transfer protein TraD [Spirochaetales bacterium]|nr:conjugal transfer protein TraD [Spirochaetales bacterium]